MIAEIEPPDIRKEEMEYLTEITRRRIESLTGVGLESEDVRDVDITVKTSYAGDEVKKIMHYHELTENQKTIAKDYDDALRMGRVNGNVNHLAHNLALTVLKNHLRRGHKMESITVKGKNHEYRLEIERRKD
jgi:hypothetical protein